MSAGHTGSVHKTRIVDKRESTAKHIASFPFTKPIKPHIYENREELENCKSALMNCDFESINQRIISQLENFLKRED